MLDPPHLTRWTRLFDAAEAKVAGDATLLQRVREARTGVDYLKYDFCNNNGTNPKTAYTIMREALKTAGRPIVFSICERPSNA